jgi:isocitrate dehydrogenase kinase/phosphatase
LPTRNAPSAPAPSNSTRNMTRAFPPDSSWESSLPIFPDDLVLPLHYRNSSNSIILFTSSSSSRPKKKTIDGTSVGHLERLHGYFYRGTASTWRGHTKAHTWKSTKTSPDARSFRRFFIGRKSRSHLIVVASRRRTRQ